MFVSDGIQNCTTTHPFACCRVPPPTLTSQPAHNAAAKRPITLSSSGGVGGTRFDKQPPVLAAAQTAVQSTEVTASSKSPRPVLRRRTSGAVSSVPAGTGDSTASPLKRSICSSTGPQAKVARLVSPESRKEDSSVALFEKDQLPVRLIKSPGSLSSMVEAMAAATSFAPEKSNLEEVVMDVREEGEISEEHEDGEIEDDLNSIDLSPKCTAVGRLNLSVSEPEDDTVVLHIDVDDKVDEFLESSEQNVGESSSRSRRSSSSSR